MFKPLRITSVEYYDDQNEIADADAKAAPTDNRDQVAYYQDNGAGESRGVWWTRTSPEGLPPSDDFLFLSPESPLGVFGRDGETVDGRHLRDLALGRHPGTGDPIAGVGTKGKRTVGFDITMSAPKSVSVLAAFSDDETRARIFDAHDRAVRRTMDFAFDEGLILTKQSGTDALTGKKIYFGEPAEASSAAVYRHFTSRAQDPQLHSHAVMMNVCVRPDGKTGAINDSKLNSFNGAVAAVYRAELASILRDELDLEVTRDGRNFVVAGITDEVCEAFSKRRAAIEELAKAGGFDTAESRRRAEIAALASRDAKDKTIPLTELEERWQGELSALGWSQNALWQSARAISREMRQDAKKNGLPSIDEVARQAVATMTQNVAVIEDRHMMRDVIEALQDRCSADEALQAVERLRASGDLVKLENKNDRRTLYSTREIVEREKAMLKAVVARKDAREFVTKAAIEKAIMARGTIRDDQAEAVRHALNRDGVSIVEGSAGSGKSFGLGAVAEIARDCGLTVYTVAPSWKATEVVRQDTDTDATNALAIPGFLNKIRSGKIVLNRDSIVIVDEAGMVGTKDMAALVEATTKAGCKLVLTGDSKQLQPVADGSPLRAMSRLVGSTRMTEITRQKAEWMQAASKDFAAGHTVAALDAYDKRGAIKLQNSREETIAALVADYTASRKAPEFLGTKDSRPVTRAILTSWNKDVMEINAAIRVAGREAGWIKGDDWQIRTFPRGGGKVRAMPFAHGDEIIFGETVSLGSTTLRNADLGRIEKIEGDASDPTLTIRLSNGRDQFLTAKVSELVGHREEGQERVPAFQHASAMTVHASQGITVDECFVANLRGMGQEGLYVAATRHRHSLKVYADVGRVAESLGVTGLVIRESRDKGVLLPEADDMKVTPDLTPEDLKRALFDESTKGDLKENASDFFDMKTFLRDGPEPVAERQMERDATPAPVVPDTAAEVRAILKPAISIAPIAEAEPAKKPAFGFDPAALRMNSPAAQLADRMAERAKMETYQKAPPKRPSNLVTKEEFDHFRQQDLQRFAQQQGLVPVTHQDETSNGFTFRTFRDPSRPDGSKVNIGQSSGGYWSFVTRDRSASGDIIGLVQWMRGGNRGQIGQELRKHFKTSPDMQPTIVRPVAHPDSKPGNAEDFGRAQSLMRHNFSQMIAGVNAYLVEKRGILPAVISRFGADIKTEPSDPKKGWFRGGTAAFAHRDLDGKIVGYERKGEGLSMMSKGGAKRTTLMGETNDPQRIYLTEASIDVLSIYQHDGQPERALLCAIGGNPSPEALDQVAALAKRYPRAEFHVGMDNDSAGKVLKGRVEEAIRRHREDDAAIIDRKPDTGFKDWNDQLRGITLADAEKAKAEQRQREEEARRQAEEEARRRQAETATARPSGPRM